MIIHLLIFITLQLKFLKIFPIYYSINVIECYVITQEPITHNNVLIMEFKDCNLYSYFHKNYDSLTLNFVWDSTGPRNIYVEVGYRIASPS
jgi:hypothetical protein